MAKFPDLSGKAFSYLGHFRNKKHIERGHNVDLTLEELEALAAKLDKDLSKDRPKEEKPKLEPKPEPPKSDIERLEDRIKLEKQLGLNRGLNKF